MKYLKEGIVYEESILREKLLEMGYNDYDFEEKAEELGYRPISEMAVQQAINEEVKHQKVLLEDALNEGFFDWAKMKIVSWSIGILPEKKLNDLWEKAISKLTPEQKKQVQKKKLSKKDKVNALRAAIRKEYEDNPSFKKKVESAAEKIKDTVKEAKEKKNNLKEGVGSVTTGISIGVLIFQIIGALIFGLTPVGLGYMATSIIFATAGGVSMAVEKTGFFD
jgi:Fe2+ transport system protein B